MNTENTDTPENNTPENNTPEDVNLEHLKNLNGLLTTCVNNITEYMYILNKRIEALEPNNEGDSNE